MQVNTSAQNVANVVEIALSWQNTKDEFIQERNRLNVMFVVNDLHDYLTLLYTAEFTVEKNRLNVVFVENDLERQVTL